MDEMRQVSQTVATVALFLLILPHALRSEYDSSVESQKVDRAIEGSMHHMATNLEKNIGMSQDEIKRISKAFEKLTEYVYKKAEKHIKPQGGGSYGYIFEFPKQ